MDEVERAAVRDAHTQLIQCAVRKRIHGAACFIRDRPQFVADLRQHSVRTVGIELQSSGIPGKIVHPERDRRVVVDVFDCHGVAPACSEISVPIVVLYTQSHLYML